MNHGVSMYENIDLNKNDSNKSFLSKSPDTLNDNLTGLSNNT